ncbi:sporulation integral membrane protein YtvI [Halothermothrix orenii]|uniref:Sporulation integral membrane protein YtvI n=1 Tax=Halothermothrix orenii (strain H 168 / OCM 544 / DSM 9562) TaxID=373903 RepID=B8CW60_HALOH|nr:sporulation integral membrane protein YtvI [Halothermothrix orenii]ACL69529.1 Sporulation integral membrane protein YtvI [Halothermothrix orenii H 168]
MEKWLKRLLIYSVVFVIGVILLKYFFIYFSPFIIAAILASLINPVVDRLDEKIPVNRGLAVIIVLVLLISILVLIIILGVSQIYLELNRLLQNLPDYSTFGSKFHWIVQQNYRLQEFIQELDISPSVKDALNNNLQMIYNAIKNGLVKGINGTLNLLGKLPMLLTILFLSFIATYFISRDKDKINQFIMKLFPGELKPKVFKVEKELINSAMGFIRAELILITITGIISGVGLAIIGNHYALIIGISSALLDLIPIIGPALIFIPWIIYNMIMGNLSYAFGLLVVYTLMAAVRQGAEGKVMGDNLGVHPLATMIALYVGYRVMGMIGFIMGPAILVIIKALINAEIIPPDKKIKG